MQEAEPGDDRATPSRRRPIVAVVALVVVAVAVAAVVWAAGREGGDDRREAVAPSLEGWRGMARRPARDGEAVAALHERLREEDPELDDLAHAAEAYDATTIVALAAAVAASDGSDLAAGIVAVSTGGETCATYAACLARAGEGADIDYEGVSGPADLLGDGDLRTGTYDVVEMGADGGVDAARTSTTVVEAEAGSGPAPPVEVERPGDGLLHVGTLLSTTGDGAATGAAAEAAVRLAVADIDAAGGFGGQALALTTAGASGPDGDPAASVGELLAADVDVVIGPAWGAATPAVVDAVVHAGVVLVSPSATVVEPGSEGDRGLFFRLAPSDRLQGRALAELVLEDGHERIALAVRDDPRGTDLAATVAEVLEAGGAEVVGRAGYAADEVGFGAAADELVAAEPDAIVVLGGAEAAGLADALITRRAGPDRVAWYGSDGVVSDATAEAFAEG